MQRAKQFIGRVGQVEDGRFLENADQDIGARVRVRDKLRAMIRQHRGATRWVLPWGKVRWGSFRIVYCKSG